MWRGLGRLQTKWRGERNSPHAVVDPDFYRRAYPDLRDLSGEEARSHWAASGFREGRIPNRSALVEHFSAIGLSLDEFDSTLYLKLYPDVVAAGVTTPESAAVHFILSGHSERRLHRLSTSVGGPTREGDDLFMWERSVITLRQWHELRAEAESDPTLTIHRRLFSERRSDPSRANPATRPPSVHDTAVLVSLFRTDRYLDGFLGNMEEQTAFDRCVFDIVLVDPSPFERDLCESFATRHSNVNLSIHSERIGIYEAWNSGIQATETRYITVTCVDDLWGPRALEMQIDFLDTHPSVDVVYHDMYLSPTYGPSWDVVKRIGFRTDLGGVTAYSLLHEFNTPANAPMWRRDIHDRYGMFDESYESAGDWEFWIRCALGSATFAKMDAVNFCYFINDEGMSRGASGPAAREARRILQTYGHLA